MSVINKMLQELDRRNAVGDSAPQSGAPAVKSVGPAARSGHEWFWRMLAVLVLICVCWVAWVAYQLQPRALVTPLVLKSGPRLLTAASRIAQPVPVVEASKVVEVVDAPKPEPITAPSMVKLAESLDTPAPRPKPRPVKAQAKKPAPTTVMLDKREHAKAPNEVAEARFRRAVALLNQARVSEAEEQLAAALQADAAHVPARQAYVALLLEQRRMGPALHLLRDAVDADPAQPVFSLGLARVYAEQREYPAALAVIEKAGAAAEGPEFQILRAAILQRLERHAEAVAAYEAALRRSPQQPGSTWAGFAISLEALGRHGEASQAYQRALGAGRLSAELREYAEARARALQ